MLDVIQVGGINNGRQSISIPDYRQGTYRTVVTTPEKVNEFLTQKKNIDTKTSKKEIISSTLFTIGGAIAGALAKVSKYSTRLGNTGIGALVGLMASFVPIIGFELQRESKNHKLSADFIDMNG